MSQHNQQSELYMGDNTTAADVLDFVIERVSNPAVFADGDVVVYNFNNQPLFAQALAEWAAEADDGVYVLPYQISGVWTFIHGALPPAIRHADLIAYRKSSDRYVDYENWRATLDKSDREFDRHRAVGDRIDEIYAAAEGDWVDND